MAGAMRRLKPYVRAAEDAGWRVEISKSGHVTFWPPKGTRWPSGDLAGPVKASATPSDGRAHKNFVADLRRAGLDVK